jgi:hypothetical protein
MSGIPRPFWSTGQRFSLLPRPWRAVRDFRFDLFILNARYGCRQNGMAIWRLCGFVLILFGKVAIRADT